MSGSGTDKTKTGVELAGPVVILVEPQLGENIGMAARAMGNFALTRLRIVNPRDGWPNISAQRAASGADHILDQVELFDTVDQAVADLTLLFATTARAHDQAKPVVAAPAAASEIAAEISGGGKVGILFGRERYGLHQGDRLPDALRRRRGGGTAGGHRPREVAAGDIDLPSGVEILNPETHIATLEKKTKLEIYLTVGHGRGYSPARTTRPLTSRSASSPSTRSSRP